MSWSCQRVESWLVRLEFWARLRMSMKSSDPRQRTLCFGRTEYASAWSSIPLRDRQEATSLWARLIAAAARIRPQVKGARR